jgi:hypothetical protein
VNAIESHTTEGPTDPVMRDAEGIHQSHHGIFVLRRLNVPDVDVAEQLALTMELYAHYTKEGRINEKLEARRLASQCDWSLFVQHYMHAHTLAVGRALRERGKGVPHA